jgi:F-type H+-transporting ATPase subunit delta
VTNRTAASRYARALFDVARQEQADLSALDRELASFADLVSRNSALEKALLNPAVPVTRKSAAMAALVERAGLSPVLAKLLKMLAERDRMVLLPDLVAAYRDRVHEYQQIVRAEVTTSVALSGDRVEHIRGRLSKALGRTVVLTPRVDAALLGGLVARVGGTVYDASLATQLKKLQSRLRG